MSTQIFVALYPTDQGLQQTRALCRALFARAVPSDLGMAVSDFSGREYSLQAVAGPKPFLTGLRGSACAVRVLARCQTMAPDEDESEALVRLPWVGEVHCDEKKRILYLKPAPDMLCVPLCPCPGWALVRPVGARPVLAREVAGRADPEALAEPLLMVERMAFGNTQIDALQTHPKPIRHTHLDAGTSLRGRDPFYSWQGLPRAGEREVHSLGEFSAVKDATRPKTVDVVAVVRCFRTTSQQEQELNETIIGWAWSCRVRATGHDKTPRELVCTEPLTVRLDSRAVVLLCAPGSTQLTPWLSLVTTSRYDDDQPDPAEQLGDDNDDAKEEISDGGDDDDQQAAKRRRVQ